MSGPGAGSTTPWTDIISAQNNPGLMAECLERLAEKYHDPIHAFILCTLRISRPEIADDPTQAFFLHFIESDALKTLDRERGRLRNRFAISVQRFAWDEEKKGRQATKKPPQNWPSRSRMYPIIWGERRKNSRCRFESRFV